MSTHCQQRRWREKHFGRNNRRNNNENQDTVVRVMSYNILADNLAERHRWELYPRTPQEFLTWSYRWELIFNEVRELEPDLLCLQEVDQFDQIQSDLNTLGYVGEYLCRSGGCKDGCATFWKREIQFVKTIRINFSKAIVLKDNVVLLTVLRIPCTNPVPLIVANTHILFNPKRGDIKLAQVRVLCDEVFKLVKKHNGLSVICGDFNSTPQSGIHNFLTQGSIHLSDYICKTLSGTLASGFHRPKTVPFGLMDPSDHQEEISSGAWHPSASDGDLTSGGASEGGHRGWWPDREASTSDGRVESRVPYYRRSSTNYDFSWALKPPPLQWQNAQSAQRLIERFHFLNDWKMDHVEITMGQFLPSLCEALDDCESVFLLGHEMELRSSYGEVLGHEPTFTTLHAQAKQTVDYVLFSPFVRRWQKTLHLEPLRVLEVPECVRHSMLPNEEHGSDHVSLCVDFRITQRKNRKRNGFRSRRRT